MKFHMGQLIRKKSFIRGVKIAISKLQAFENLPRFKIKITVVVKTDLELSRASMCCFKARRSSQMAQREI